MGHDTLQLLPMEGEVMNDETTLKGPYALLMQKRFKPREYRLMFDEIESLSHALQLKYSPHGMSDDGIIVLVVQEGENSNDLQKRVLELQQKGKEK